MNQDLTSFIEKAREKGLDDTEIRSRLTAAEWSTADVEAALAGDDLVVPVPPVHQSTQNDEIPQTTTAKTQLLTADEQWTKATLFQFHMMFITLWLVVIAAFWTINALLFTTDYGAIKFPITVVVVCLPVWLALFMRVRRLEAQRPDFKRTNDRLLLIHGSQSLAFILLLVHTIYLVYQLVSASDSLGQQAVSWVCSLAIFGGLFWYYWVDTRKTANRTSG